MNVGWIEMWILYGTSSSEGVPHMLAATWCQNVSHVAVWLFADVSFRILIFLLWKKINDEVGDCDDDIWCSEYVFI